MILAGLRGALLHSHIDQEDGIQRASQAWEWWSAGQMVDVWAPNPDHA